ncbi:MAG: hypothetical protein ABSC20_08005 [Candidatus Bathyarchaeia archaeon]
MTKGNCPVCDKPMEARPIKITVRGKEIKDTVYVCSSSTCKGAFIPESIFGVRP